MSPRVVCRRKYALNAWARFLKKVQFAPLTVGAQYDKLVHVNFYGEIAQLVERRTHKPKVKGSIPFLATIFSFVCFCSGKLFARFVTSSACLFLFY